MKSDFGRHILLLVCLIFLQIMVLQSVHFWSVTPFIYLFSVIVWPSNWSVYLNLLVGFVSGLVLDFCLDSPGMHTMSLTLVAYLRLPLLRWCSARDEVVSPSEKSMGFLSFWKYAFLMVLIHHSCFFLVESFGFFSFWSLICGIFGSTLATLLLVFFLERFR